MSVDEYDVYSDFDLEKHKKKYVNYLEVMIDKDGKVEYAVPSHQEKAVAMACDALDVSRVELGDMTPAEFYFDWMTWLLRQSGAMAVWYDGYICESPTKAQYAALRRLKMGGVYKGVLPEMKRSKAMYGGAKGGGQTYSCLEVMVDKMYSKYVVQDAINIWAKSQ